MASRAVHSESRPNSVRYHGLPAATKRSAGANGSLSASRRRSPTPQSNSASSSGSELRSVGERVGALPGSVNGASGLSPETSTSKVTWW